MLQARGRMALHFLASARRESKLKIAVVAVFTVLLWLGIFAFARFGFGVFEDFGAELLGSGELSLSDLIMGRLLSVFTLALFVMLIFSNLLAAFAFFYRAHEVPLLIESPISVSTFFLGRFAECVSFSSWALGYLGSPVMIAYGLTTGAPPIFYFALIAFYLPFVVLPAAIGAAATLLLVRVFAGLRRGMLVVVALVLVMVIFSLFRERLRLPDFADTASLQAVIDQLAQAQGPWLPSFWTAQGVLSTATGELGEALFYWLVLVANALFAVWLATEVAKRFFYPGWCELVGSDESRGVARGGILLGQRGLLGWLELRSRRVLSPSTLALMIKDLRMFWRDAAQASQFLLLFGIMAVYIANLESTRSGTEEELWRAWGTLLNMAACALILASLTSRFIYPLISLEGRRFWLLGLAPIERRRLVWQKFWLSVGSTAFFTVSLIALSAWRLELDGVSFALSVVGAAATTLALSGLAVGLGSLYLNFADDNPARIVSGLGGTLNFMFSLLYVVLVLVAQALVLLWHRFASDRFAADLFPWVAVGAAIWIVGLTAVACLVPMRLGIRNLENTEL